MEKEKKHGVGEIQGMMISDHTHKRSTLYTTPQACCAGKVTCKWRWNKIRIAKNSSILSRVAQDDDKEELLQHPVTTVLYSTAICESLPSLVPSYCIAGNTTIHPSIFSFDTLGPADSIAELYGSTVCLCVWWQLVHMPISFSIFIILESW